jgi:hypothetical protein
MSLDGVTWPNGGLPRGMVVGPACQVCKGAGPTLVRWTNGCLPRVIVLLTWPNQMLPCDILVEGGCWVVASFRSPCCT